MYKDKKIVCERCGKTSSELVFHAGKWWCPEDCKTKKSK